MNNQKKDFSLSFCIEDGVIYKYDLKNCLFSVSRYKSDTVIHFMLNIDEKIKIINEYYNLHLDKLDSVFEVQDECRIMPTVYTTLYVKRDTTILKKIVIDESCSNFYLNNFIEANRIKSFLRFVGKILQSKPEIKNAPESDIILM